MLEMNWSILSTAESREENPAYHPEEEGPGYKEGASSCGEAVHRYFLSPILNCLGQTHFFQRWRENGQRDTARAVPE